MCPGNSLGLKAAIPPVHNSGRSSFKSKGVKGIFRACLISANRWRSTSPIKYRVMWNFVGETRATPRFQVQVFWYRVSAVRIGCGGQMARKMRASPAAGSGEAFSWAMAMLWIFYDESAFAIVLAADRKDKGPSARVCGGWLLPCRVQSPKRVAQACHDGAAYQSASQKIRW